MVWRKKFISHLLLFLLVCLYCNRYYCVLASQSWSPYNPSFTPLSLVSLESPFSSLSSESYCPRRAQAPSCALPQVRLATEGPSLLIGDF